MCSACGCGGQPLLARLPDLDPLFAHATEVEVSRRFRALSRVSSDPVFTGRQVPTHCGRSGNGWGIAAAFGVSGASICAPLAGPLCYI